MARHACKQLTLAEQIRRNLANPVRVSLHGISCVMELKLDALSQVSHVTIVSSVIVGSTRVAMAAVDDDSLHATMMPTHFVYRYEDGGYGKARVEKSDPQGIVDGMRSSVIEKIVVSFIKHLYIVYGDHFTCVEFKYDVSTGVVHATRYGNRCYFKLDKILVDGNIKGELLMREIVSGLSS